MRNFHVKEHNTHRVMSDAGAYQLQFLPCYKKMTVEVFQSCPK